MRGTVVGETVPCSRSIIDVDTSVFKGCDYQLASFICRVSVLLAEKLLMAGNTILRYVHSLTEDIVSGLEVLFGGRIHEIPDHWTHVTKIDPEVDRQLPLLYSRYLEHTSAVSVGGSSNVTPINTEETFRLLSRVSSPILHEPSDPSHVTDVTRESADFLAIPEVLNGSSEAFVGTLGAGIDSLRSSVVPRLLDRKLPIWLRKRLDPQLSALLTSILLNKALFEAYIIQNPDSAAAREADVTGADVLTPDAARRHAIGADIHLQSEVVYVEYSGTYGGQEATAVISAICEDLEWSRLWYGGGIENRDQVREVTEAGADAVVIGNLFHEIASEEFELYERSRSEWCLEGSWNINEFGAWISENVDIASTATARYLSTVDVDSPEETATRLLATTLSTYAGIEQIRSKYSEQTPREQCEAFFEEYPQCGYLLRPNQEEYIEEIFSRISDSVASGDRDIIRHTPVVQL